MDKNFILRFGISNNVWYIIPLFLKFHYPRISLLLIFSFICFPHHTSNHIPLNSFPYPTIFPSHHDKLSPPLTSFGPTFLHSTSSIMFQMPLTIRRGIKMGSIKTFPHCVMAPYFVFAPPRPPKNGFSTMQYHFPICYTLANPPSLPHPSVAPLFTSTPSKINMLSK